MPTRLKIPKDPNDIDDLTWEWAARLDTGETISTFTASIVAGGGTVGAQTIDGTTTIARISGGTAGTRLDVLGRIVTSTGRQLDWTAYLPMAAQ